MHEHLIIDKIPAALRISAFVYFIRKLIDDKKKNKHDKQENKLHL